MTHLSSLSLVFGLAVTSPVFFVENFKMKQCWGFFYMTNLNFTLSPAVKIVLNSESFRGNFNFLVQNFFLQLNL